MRESHKQFQEVFEELDKLSLTDRIFFLEELLFYFTLTGRGIWSDDKPTDTEKVVAFKWLNELIHKVWNIRSELQKGEDNDSTNRLYENMTFYGEQSDILRMHLVPTTLGAFNNFTARHQ